MGIKGLVHLLQPYATRLVFPECDPASNNHADATTSGRPAGVACLAVIDGPALAYHAYYRALARRSSARNALDAMPSYAEVGQVAVECLDTLEKHGIEIAAIFFDGVLPDVKREVRMDRLTGYLRQLENYRSDHSSANSYGEVDTRGGVAPSNIFSPAQTPAKLKHLPALPFLVPSVIDTLQSTRFDDLTSVISGEADAFCAAFAREHGAMIITSDSDLLVYEIGDKSSVLLLRDIELSEASTGAVLNVCRYEPTSIAQRLKLTTLQPLAFAVSQEPHASIKSYVKQASQLQLSPSDDYKEFVQNYILPSLEKTTPTTPQRVLRTLDPRISEWVHKSSILNNDPFEAEAIPFYLPFLIEDPSRLSAWTASIPIRQLAYSILKPASTTVYSTAEFTRRGNRITGFAHDHIFSEAIQNSLQNLDISFRKARILVTASLLWPLMAIYTICDYLQTSLIELPQTPLLRELLAKRDLRRGNNWARVHLSAMFQAALYSFRVLKQCVALHQALGLGLLNFEFLTSLQDMPPLAELLDVPGDTIEDGDLFTAMSALYEMLHIQEPAEFVHTIPPSKKQQKRKRQKERAKEERIDRTKKSHAIPSTNMYNLLLPDA